MHLRVRSNIIVACEKMQLVVTRNLAVNNWIALAQDFASPAPAVEVIASLVRCIAIATHLTSCTVLLACSNKDIGLPKDL